MESYKRTLVSPDGVHTIVYQDNGWVQHIMEHPDGTREEWLDLE